MKNKKISAWIILAIFCLALALTNLAQAQQKSDTSQSDVILSTLNIYNAELVSQDGSNLKISFDLANEGKLQPAFKYGLMLTQSKNGSQTLIDQKVFSDEVSLGENSAVTKMADYAAPTYLEGKYNVWVVAKNDSGLTLSVTFVKEITLSGNGQFVEINNDSCYLKVDGEKSNAKYTIGQGVDITSKEKLIATCDVTNNFGRTITVSPKFGSFWRNVYGKPVEDNNEPQPDLTLNAGEKKTVSMVIPKAAVPQAYDADLVFWENGTAVSNHIIFHYVLRGASATIQNLKLDNDYYKQGDLADISLYWTGPADGFAGSRLGGGSALDKIEAQVLLKNNQGQDCIDPVSQEKNAGESYVNIAAPVKTDCQNPIVTAKITDKNGNVLDQKVYKIESKSLPAQSQAPSQNVSLKNRIKTVVIVIIALAFLISLALIVIKKKKMRIPPVAIFIFAAATGLFFLNAVGAKADAVWYGDVFYGNGGDMNFSAQFNRPLGNYCPGDTITVTGHAGVTLCSNQIPRPTRLTMTFNGQTYTFFNTTAGTGELVGSATVPFPSSPGSYTAHFVGAVDFYTLTGRYSSTSTTSGDITINVKSLDQCKPSCPTFQFNPAAISAGQSTKLFCSLLTPGQSTTTLNYSCNGNLGSGSCASLDGLTSSQTVTPTSSQTCSGMLSNSYGTTTCTAPVTVTGGTGCTSNGCESTTCMPGTGSPSTCDNGCSGGGASPGTKNCSAGAKYLCLASGCVQSVAGTMDLATCSANCTTPNGRYNCVLGGGCQQNNNGSYADATSCNASCGGGTCRSVTVNGSITPRNAMVGDTVRVTCDAGEVMSPFYLFPFDIAGSNVTGGITYSNPACTSIWQSGCLYYPCTYKGHLTTSTSNDFDCTLAPGALPSGYSAYLYGNNACVVPSGTNYCSKSVDIGQLMVTSTKDLTNGVCGPAAQQYYSSTPPSNLLCLSGQATYLSFNGVRQWNWKCLGYNGGTDKSCQSLASAPVCGNGIVEGSEQCDSGANNGACPKTCSATCTNNSCPPPVACGNGIVEGSEQCDSGANNGACPKTCSATCTNNTCSNDNNWKEIAP